VSYLGLPADSVGRHTQQTAPFGVALSDAPFRDGTISVDIEFSPGPDHAAGVVLGFESLESPYVMATVGGYERAYSIAEFQPARGWMSIASAGVWSNLQSDRPYRLEVTLRGQSLALQVDGIPVLSATLPAPLRGSAMGLFAWGNEPARFETLRVGADPPRLFVIMPFAEPFDTLYREVIKPVAKELAFGINRVDEIQAPGIILDDIQRQIAESHAVVAEVSSRNPNVFYELGFAHALGKPAVILVRRDDAASMPFDIRGYRAIFYDDSIGGKRKVENLLRQHLTAVVGRGEVIEAAS
jgi:hypothetical protein